MLSLNSLASQPLSLDSREIAQSLALFQTALAMKEWRTRQENCELVDHHRRAIVVGASSRDVMSDYAGASL